MPDLKLPSTGPSQRESSDRHAGDPSAPAPGGSADRPGSGRGLADRPVVQILLFAACASLAASALFVGAEWWIAGRLGPSIDDGWIYLAFARHLAEEGVVGYPGREQPVASITGPAWLAVLAGAIRLVGGVEMLLLKAVAILTGVAAVLSAAWLGLVATGRRDVALWAGAILAWTGRFQWGVVSLMEVPLCVAATCAGLALHLHARRQENVVLWLPAAAVLSVAGWSRPECFAFVAFAGLDRVWARRTVEREGGASAPPPWRDLSVPSTLAVVVVLLAVYPLWHVGVYGHPLPTTFYAKAGSGAPWRTAADEGLLPALLQVVVHVPQQFVGFLGWAGSHLPFVAAGLLVGLVRGFRARDGVPVVFGAFVFFSVARGALGLAPAAFQHGRYYAQLWPLLLIVCLAGFAPSPRSGFKRRFVVPALVLVAVAAAAVVDLEPTALAFAEWPMERLLTDVEGAVLFWGVPAALLGLALVGLLLARSARGPGGAGIAVPALPSPVVVLWLVATAGAHAWHHGRNVEDTWAMNVAMAESVREHTPPGATVACHDVGALGFFAERRLLDLAGLTSPEVTFMERDADGSVFARALSTHRPDYLCTLDDWMAKLNPSGSLPEGLRRFQEIEEARIVRPENITLSGGGGDRYFLFRLVWD